MTFLLVGLAAMGLLLLPGAVARFGSRLPPREWVWLCVVAVAGGAALLETALVLRAAPGVLDILGVHAVAAACVRVLGPLIAGGPAVTGTAAVAAAVLAVAAMASVLAGRRLRHRLHADLWLGQPRRIAGHDVVVLPTDRPMALSFVAGEPTIVVSRGLLHRLADDEVAAVVRHEAAHLAARHQRLLTVIEAIAPVLGRLPGVRRSFAALHLAVERTADERAVGASPVERDTLHRTLLHLLDVTELPAGVAGFAEARTIAARVAALAAPPPQLPGVAHAALYVPGTMAATAIIPGLYRWGDQLHGIVAMAGRCAL